MESRSATRVPKQRGAAHSFEHSDAAWVVLQARLGDQWAEIRTQELRIRRGQPEGVHKMRVALRRTRSLLTTYEEFFEPGVAAPLVEDLRWTGNVLGAARDAEVIRGRLHALIAELPQENGGDATRPSSPAGTSRWASSTRTGTSGCSAASTTWSSTLGGAAWRPGPSTRC